MIKVILFDADGVLITPPGYGSQHAFKEAGLDGDLLLPFFRGVFRSHCLVGKADLKEVIKPFLDNAGWTKSIDEFLHEWFSYEHVLDERVIVMIKKYKDMGIVCSMATNQEKYRKEYLKNEMGFGDLFETMYVACDLGVDKESGSDYFEQVFDDLQSKISNLKKEEVLLWDDSKEVIQKANEFGFHAELYTDFELFSEKMKEYGL